MKHRKILSVILAVVGACCLLFAGATLVSAETATNAFAFEAGASVRYTEPTTGLRFTLKLGSEQYAALTSDGENYNSGMGLSVYIAPSDYFTAADGDYQTLAERAVKAEIPVNKIYTDGDYYYANAVLSNILYENTAREFRAIGAIEGGAETVWSEVSDGRSVAYVSSAALALDEGLSDGEKTVLNGFVQKAIAQKSGVSKDEFVSDGSYKPEITMDDGALLIMGDTLTLNPVITPDAGLYETWTSDSAVATVSGGVVTPVSAGTANITVTVAGASATCAVVVAESNIFDQDFALAENISFWQGSGNIKTSSDYIRIGQGIDNNTQAPYPSATLSSELLETAYEHGYRYITLSYTRGPGNTESGGDPPYVAIYTKDGYQESSTSANRVWNSTAASGEVLLTIADLIDSQGEYTLQIRVYGGWAGIYNKYYADLTSVKLYTESGYLGYLLENNTNFASDGMTGFYTMVWEDNKDLAPTYEYNSSKGGIVLTNAQRLRLSADVIACAVEAGYTSVTCSIKLGGTTDAYWMFVRTYDTATDASKNLVALHGTETTEQTVTVDLEDLYYTGTKFADYTNSYVLMFHLSNDWTNGVITNVTFNK